nr:hypothetical protein [uncultured Flavobacterium sp.]
MKSHSKKTVIGLLALIALTLAFYPAKDKHDITGEWHLDNITINGKPLSLNEYATHNINVPRQYISIDRQSININLLNNKNIQVPLNVNNDALTIDTDNEFFKGTYKLNFSEKINLRDNVQAKEYKLKLTSKDKTINLSRDEAVKWIQPQVQKGRP